MRSEKRKRLLVSAYETSVLPLGCTFPAVFDHRLFLCASNLPKPQRLSTTNTPPRAKIGENSAQRHATRIGRTSPRRLLTLRTWQSRQSRRDEQKQLTQHVLSATQPPLSSTLSNPPLRSPIDGRTERHSPARSGCLAQCQCLDAANQLRVFG
jgi:hypothetical protein